MNDIIELRKIAEWSGFQEEVLWLPVDGNDPTIEQIVELYRLCQEHNLTSAYNLALMYPNEAPTWLLERFWRNRRVAVPQHDDIAYEGRVDFVFKVDGVAYVVMTADRKCFRAEAVEVV